MARYFNDFDDDRELHARRDRFAREQPWNYSRGYSSARLESDYDRRDIGRGRFGERADYEMNEPNYSEYATTLSLRGADLSFKASCKGHHDA